MAEEKSKAEAIKTGDGEQPKEQEFIIQRIYVKDLSYEAPGTPQIFRTEWRPIVNLDISTKSVALEDSMHEVVLTVTATVKLGESTAFIIEVKQAGIFTLRAFAPEQLQHLLWSHCPSILFPYARQVISDEVVRGGFPPLYLAPINFDVLYQQHLQRQATQKGDTQQTH